MYQYKYPHYSITADCVVFGRNEAEGKVCLLLVERKNNPYKGFSIIHEPADYSYAPQLINEVPDNSIFEGGWYSYRYFSNVEYI